ncbi:extracellular solute-binding protein [Erysipelothrix aquatica]|uniref:extracellular solute-binding protein n=1 Tax=Erysipelothrix aquatica TaxID=2683714 RepID=UPI00135A30CC|nr:extracellular solute-binding protein [Erysipelothrix aquatica]
MKNIKKYFVVLLAVLVLVGCSSGSGSKGNTDIVTEVPAGTEITFWHAMNGGQQDALVKITEDFMAANPNIKVTLQNQSKYPDLQSKINQTIASPKDLPTITQAYPNWLWNAATQDKVLVDLDPFINHETIGLKDKADILPVLMNGAKVDGVQYGIPFNKSTEVLYYNKTLLDQYGVKVPTTMEELASASKEIFEKSNGQVIGAGFDSLNNYYAIGMANEGKEFTKDLDIAGPESLKVAKFYQDGVKEGYFRIADKGEYLSTPFGAGLLAMNVGSMAGESHVKKAVDGRYEYGAAVRPDVKNIQQGTDIYMFNSATPEQQTAAFLYMSYLVSPEAQLHWATKTGYMPVSAKVQASDEYKNSGSLIAKILSDATKDLFAIPVIENSDPAYNKTREMMELILSDPSSDAQAILNDYKVKVEAEWNQ